ncbi:MAG: DNA translocase FtsK 4TM domain-containing protein, partial [Candidatus Paceibacterales bacterium]
MKNRYRESTDNKKHSLVSLQMKNRLKEGFFLVSVAFALFLFISLVTYHVTDPGWSSTGLNGKALNWGGKVGAWLADIFLSLFGIASYLFPFLLVLSSWFRVEGNADRAPSREWVFRGLGWIFLLSSLCGLVSFYFHPSSHLPADSGGIIGDLVGSGLSLLFNKTGTTLLFVTFFLFGMTLLTGLSWFAVMEIVGERLLQFANYLQTRFQQWRQNRAALKLAAAKLVAITKKIESRPIKPVIVEKAPPVVREEPKLTIVATSPKSPPSPPIVKFDVVAREKEKKKPEAAGAGHVTLKEGELPPLSLLNPPAISNEKPFSHISFEALSELVEQRLADFGVEAKVVAVLPGPVITRFELDLAPGVKVSKITGLAKDIARSLSAISVRVVEVIPGKSVIGLEIPNENREVVTLREILESQRYSQSRSPVSLVLG